MHGWCLCARAALIGPTTIFPGDRGLRAKRGLLFDSLRSCSEHADNFICVCFFGYWIGKPEERYDLIRPDMKRWMEGVSIRLRSESKKD